MNIPLSYESQALRRRMIWPAYMCESLSAVGATLLTCGIFFYTEHYLSWGLKENFLLAAAQGAAYMMGSLLAHATAQRFGRRRGLIGIFLVLAFITAIAITVTQPVTQPVMLVIVLLLYTFVMALTWPALESLVCSDADARTLSRRVGIYNFVWSGTNAVVFAVSGAIIQHWPGGLFAVPACVHVVSAVLMWRSRDIEPTGEPSPTAHAEPEPELLAQRTLAMWLARIALPATYVVIFSLMAMMPSLPVMQSLDTTWRTAIGSIWMAARWFMFLYLGATAWWHTRPRLLLLAAGAMLIAFLGITVRPSELLGGGTNAAMMQSINLASMIGWQIALGAALGLIYASSLYFGMVLSDGSTEHGGYHEALIGLGSILGPGAAALTQLVWPGDLRAGVVAVSGMIAISIAAAGVASIKAGRKASL